MDKDNKIILINQQNLTITGIKKVLAVSEISISLLIESSTLHISGEKMEVKKLDVESGLLEVEGKVNGLKFFTAREKLNFFKRIFK